MSVKRSILFAVVLFTILITIASAQGYKVGFGRVDIVPESGPIYLSGYGSRVEPATSVVQRVWAKAMVIEDAAGTRFAIITAELLGFTREMIGVISVAVDEKHNIKRDAQFFNSSHTHSAPIIWPCVIGHDFNDPAELEVLLKQNYAIMQKFITAVDMAVNDLSPAVLTFGKGSAGYAINRRRREVAPIDHSVPVLRIANPDGKLRGVLFNYACHCTTVGFRLIHGDHAGFAMTELEEAYPGITAMFVQGCAADQNPDPRGTMEHVSKYGKELSYAVQKVLEGEMKPINGAVRVASAETRLSFKPVPLQSYQEERFDENRYKRERAQRMLLAYNTGNPVESIPYMVQGLHFGNDLTFLFLSGEIVIDYTLRAKKEFPDKELLVAGYCSEVQCYIPSLRVLREGGYEADSSMIYYGLPGPFDEDVEERVFSLIRKVVE